MKRPGEKRWIKKLENHPDFQLKQSGTPGACQREGQGGFFKTGCLAVIQLLSLSCIKVQQLTLAKVELSMPPKAVSSSCGARRSLPDDKQCKSRVLHETILHRAFGSIKVLIPEHIFKRTFFLSCVYVRQFVRNTEESSRSCIHLCFSLFNPVFKTFLGRPMSFHHDRGMHVQYAPKV